MGDQNIRRDEAAARARVIDADAYVIEVDLRDAPAGATFASRTTVRFTCREPGATTWIDLVAAHLQAVTLNGRSVDVSTYDGARIPLPGLAADNQLVVEARCRYMRTGEGLHRSVDPADGSVYLYTQFATADARRVFACFEQPDLKATFQWDVVAPAGWTMVSTSATPDPEPLGHGFARWAFAPTPPLPTYLAVLCAGPFACVRDRYEGPNGAYPLAVHVRASMAEHLDSAEILEVTRQGLAYYEQAFGTAYPFGTYAQVFVPEFNLGAMENPGAVTFREDGFLFRSRATEAERENRANVILHEMAHMWFGDLVTMRWWDDLWLNESFAEWAGHHVAAVATRHAEAWTSFAQARKAWAYRQDQLPSTHPIVADAVDLESVYLNFDGITYAKGASVLKQLVAWVGHDAFLAGLRRYFDRYAWGSTTLADLLAELEATSGRDLSEWARVWLREAGVTTLEPVVEVGDDGLYRRVVIRQLPATRPEGVSQVLRPHRVALGLYRAAPGSQGAQDPGAGGPVAADGGRAQEGRPESLVRDLRVEVDVRGPATEVPALVGVPAAEVLLVNDDDLTYAKIRLDAASHAVAMRALGALDGSLPRALVWGSLWEEVRDALLPAQDFIDLALRELVQEDRPGIIETVLRQAHTARTQLVADRWRERLALRLCEGSARLLDAAEPGSDRQLALARAHVACAVAPRQLGRLADLLAGRADLPGLVLDQDLRWMVVVRLCARGVGDAELVGRELDRDRTTKGRQSAARAMAALPTAEAKEAAWRSAVESRGLPNAVLEATIAGFADPEWPDLLAPYRDRYVDAVQGLWGQRSPAEASTLATGLFPGWLVEKATVAGADALLGRRDLPSGLRRIVTEGRDGVRRALECRAASDAAPGLLARG